MHLEVENSKTVVTIPLQENRSLSANDLCSKPPSEAGNNLHSISPTHHSVNSIHHNKLRETENDAVHQDEGVLKRSAPGETSGYYSNKFYQSLPHHYKLSSVTNAQGLHGQGSKENTADPSSSSIEYSQKLSLILDWFKGFSSAQKNKLLSSLLNECEQPQNHHISMLIQDSLHINCPPNCQDFLLWLPSFLSFKILNYLDPVSLARCGQVCKHWNNLSQAQFLWQKLCMQPAWKLTQEGHHKQINLIVERDKKISWKKVWNLNTLQQSHFNFIFYDFNLGLCRAF